MSLVTPARRHHDEQRETFQCPQSHQRVITTCNADASLAQKGHHSPQRQRTDPLDSYIKYLVLFPN